MFHRNNVNKGMLLASILFMGLLNQPIKAAASGSLYLNNGGHRDRHEERRDGRYTEVVVGNDRYYYDAGVFYRQDQGNYVVSEAPVGAVVYSVPSGYERVDVDGVSYVRYGNVYYRPAGRGYEVVRLERSRDQRDNHGRDGDRRDQRQDQHHGE